MQKITIKKYKNKTIHHIIKKAFDDNEPLRQYCDSNPTKIIDEHIMITRKAVLEIKLDKEHGTYSLAGNEYLYSIQLNSPEEFRKFFTVYDFNKCGHSIDYLPERIINEPDILYFKNLRISNKTNLFISFTKCKYKKIGDKEYLDCTIEIKRTFYYCVHCKQYIDKPSKTYGSYINEEVLGEYIFYNKDTVKRSVIKKEIWYNKNNACKRYYKDVTVFNKERCQMYHITNMFISGDELLKAKHPQKIKDVTFKDWCYKRENDMVSIGFYSLIAYALKETHPKLFEYTCNDLINFSLESKKLYNENKTKLGILGIPKKGGGRPLFPQASTAKPIYEEKDFEISNLIRIMHVKLRLGINNTLLANLICLDINTKKGLLPRLKGMKEKDIFKRYGINNKKLHTYSLYSNRYLNNLCMFYENIKDINYLDKIIMKKTIYNVIKQDVKYKDFLYQYCKHNSKERAYNQLMKIESYTLSDTIRMFQSLRKNDKKYKCNFDLPIKTLHDIFSADLDKINRPNLKIAENKELQTVFSSINVPGIKYIQPTETYELINIGSYMNICVGGYDNKAARQSCFIVAGYDEKDNPVTCIELRKVKVNENKISFAIMQVKKKYNNIPEEDEANILTKSFINAGYSINTYDLNNSTVEHKEHDYKYNEYYTAKVKVRKVTKSKLKIENNVEAIEERQLQAV